MIIWHSGCKIVDINELWNLGYNFLCHPVPHFLGGYSMKNHIGNRWEIMILGNPQIEWPLEPQQPLWGRRGLLRWVNIGHFFSFSLPTKRGTNPLGAPLMRSAYSMRKFRPRWTSSSSLFFFLSNLLFFLFSRRRPRIFVSSENDGPSLVKVIGENECTEYTEITYFQPSLRCFQGTRETMASHFLSIPEQQREVSLRMYLFQIQGVPILLGHFLDFDRSLLGLTMRRKDNQEKRYTYLSE